MIKLKKNVNNFEKKSLKKICQFQKWQYLCTAFRHKGGVKQ